MQLDHINAIGKIDSGLIPQQINGSILRRISAAIHWLGHLGLDEVPRSGRNALCARLEKLSVHLNDIMGEILVAENQIALVSGEIANSSQSLFQAAQEATVSSTSQEKHSVSFNAENVSDQTREKALTLTERSVVEKNVLTIFKNVAFRTNLIALNADVEAVRVGWHGKVFSVVAEQAHKLSALGTNVAAETSELIEVSVNKTDSTRALIAQATQNLQEIISGVDMLTDLVADLVASNKQAKNISEIRQLIPVIDSGTQLVTDKMSGPMPQLQQYPQKTISNKGKHSYSTLSPRPHQHQGPGRRWAHSKGCYETLDF